MNARNAEVELKRIKWDIKKSSLGQFTNKFDMLLNTAMIGNISVRHTIPNFVKNPPNDHTINSIHDISEVSSELLSDDDAADPQHQISSIYSPDFDIDSSPSSDSYDSNDSMTSSSTHLRPIISSFVNPSELTNQQEMELLINDTSTEITSDHHHFATILAPEDSSTQPTVTSTDIEMSLSNLQLCSVTQTINDHDSSPAISPSSSFDHDADFSHP
jgi:hypothetical protein